MKLWSLVRVAAAASMALATIQAGQAPAAEPAAAAQGIAAQPGQAATQNAARGATTPAPLPKFTAVNNGEPNGDQLALPRQVAAVVVAMDTPAPRYVVDVGSFTGEFLEAFMDRFPAARGQWTEPVDGNLANSKRRLARFGERINFKIGCPGRDISDGCAPKDADVIITSWVSIHQPIDGIQKMYKDVYAQLPKGGWFANLDHVTFQNQWDSRLQRARLYFDVVQQGPPAHLATPFPTLGEHQAALKAAGFTDVQVVWQSFTTVLMMAKK
jgi:tRNA (cmo5U34)-methyltransferase